MFTDKKSSEQQKLSLWKYLDNKFNLVKAEDIDKFLGITKPNYQYLEDFIYFAKNIDAKICMLALPKDDYIFAAVKDIEAGLEKYCNNPTVEYPILFTGYVFEDKRHGPSFCDVYLLFFCEGEKELLNLFYKFEKMRAFL